jgi:hypothetical protein
MAVKGKEVIDFNKEELTFESAFRQLSKDI